MKQEFKEALKKAYHIPESTRKEKFLRELEQQIPEPTHKEEFLRELEQQKQPRRYQKKLSKLSVWACRTATVVTAATFFGVYTFYKDVQQLPPDFIAEDPVVTTELPTELPTVETSVKETTSIETTAAVQTGTAEAIVLGSDVQTECSNDDDINVPHGSENSDGNPEATIQQQEIPVQTQAIGGAKPTQTTVVTTHRITAHTTHTTAATSSKTTEVIYTPELQTTLTTTPPINDDLAVDSPTTTRATFVTTISMMTTRTTASQNIAFSPSTTSGPLASEAEETTLQWNDIQQTTLTTIPSEADDINATATTCTTTSQDIAFGSSTTNVTLTVDPEETLQITAIEQTTLTTTLLEDGDDVNYTTTTCTTTNQDIAFSLSTMSVPLTSEPKEKSVPLMDCGNTYTIKPHM